MYKSSTIDLKKTAVLNNLVSDYLDKKESVKQFYGQYPNLEGFKKFLASNPYSDFDRKKLSRLLLEQSKLVGNTSQKSLHNLSIIEKTNCFTVTTGHQLCLFTGPLYFVYKILSTIRLAEELKKEFPSFDFVPVYWMASEDHDFEEINHFYTNNKTVKWETTQTGAVGKFNSKELKSIVHQISEAFGISKNAKQLLSLFENAYLKHSDLTSATRFLVNELFGEYGLIIIDGDDKAFKSQFKVELKEDIFNEASSHAVNKTISELSALGYGAQVNPRDINCFYLEQSRRTRIEKSENDFILVDNKQKFSKAELQSLIDSFPEKISPNVVLRPLYQQKILPNLAYIGGPGELAYWLEFKSMFDDYKIAFPILVPRKFITIIEKTTKTKIEKLGFSTEAVFSSEQSLINKLQEQSNKLFEIESELKIIDKLFSALKKRTHEIDQSLDKKVAADHQKTINHLNSISKKTNKALRKQFDVEINQIKSIKETLFPKGIPQERYENFCSFYLKHGTDFIEYVKTSIDPFKLEMLILEEG